MLGISNLERKGQFIANRIDIVSNDNFFYMSNFDLDNLLREYRDHLINHGICPVCYNNLKQPDAQIEDKHCHNCGFILGEHRKFVI